MGRCVKIVKCRECGKKIFGFVPRLYCPVCAKERGKLYSHRFYHRHIVPVKQLRERLKRYEGMLDVYEKTNATLNDMVKRLREENRMLTERMTERITITQEEIEYERGQEVFRFGY